ncbi:MAG: hypothetical protein ACRDFR_08985 [Candidatus Limnocylindria bacterium]
MIRVTTRSGLALTLMALTVACAPSSNPSTPESPSSGPSSVEACEPLTLLTPQGNRIDLTGTWSGRGALHYLRQSGSCVWWIALSNIPGEPAGSAHSIIFHGRVHADFTLTGEWAFVIKPSRPDAPPAVMEHITFSIEVVEADGQEAVVLHGPGADPETGGPVANFYSAITLERVGPLPVGG